MRCVHSPVRWTIKKKSEYESYYYYSKMIKGLVQGESAPFIFKLRLQYETQK